MADYNNYSSFDYKVINRQIRRILDTRATLDNTVQMAMPFIKVTSTVELEEYLGKGNTGFTLGIHGFPSEAELYAGNVTDPVSGEGKLYPLVGYTYTDGGAGKFGVAKPIHAQPPASTDNTLNAFFDLGQGVHDPLQMFDLMSPHSTEATYIRPIPPPGITQVNISRNRNGTVASAKVTISVPSLLQLEFLHRTFLIPGVGMVIEWGQQFTPSEDLGESGLVTKFIEGVDPSNPQYSSGMFPWYRRDKLNAMLERLKDKSIGMEEMLKCYIYPSQGQYAWMFGRLANFSVKAITDGSFTVEMTIYGSSEDGYAYATRNTVMPVPRRAIPAAPERAGTSRTRPNTAPTAGTSATGTSAAVLPPTICLEDVNSIWTYFTNTSRGLNFKTLLDDVKSSGNRGGNAKLQAWRNHVKFFQKGNAGDGEPTTNPDNPNISQQSFGDTQDAYFISWRFFVNVVINHPQYGLRAVFQNAAISPEAKQKISLLEPYVPSGSRYPYFDPQGSYICDTCDTPGAEYIWDLKESFVGFNPHLRSVNPGTMLLVNEAAATLAKQDSGDRRNRSPRDSYNRPLYEDTAAARDFRANGSGQFDLSTTAYYLANELTVPDVEKQDRGFLTSGVWINHKAVVLSMASADTVLRGVSNLLNRMNQATNNFWELTLDSSDPVLLGEENLNVCDTPITTQGSTQQTTFRVVDSKWRKDSNTIATEFLDNVHIFNKFIRNRGSTILGSDVLECNVDLSLPKLMFSQIAALGIAQPTTQVFSVPGSAPSVADTQCPGGSISDPQDALRHMFSITSITPSLLVSDGSGSQILRSPDRTYNDVRPITPNANNATPCRPVSVPPAQVSGRPGPQVIVTQQMDAIAASTLTIAATQDLAQLQSSIKNRENILKDACETCVTCTTATTPVTPRYASDDLYARDLPLVQDTSSLTEEQVGDILTFVKEIKRQGDNPSLKTANIEPQNNLRYVLALISKISPETGWERRILKEQGYSTTNVARIRSLFQNRLDETENSTGFNRCPGGVGFPRAAGVQAATDAQINALKSNDANFFNRVYGRKWGELCLGNTQAGDGFKYVGRAWIGITGREGYTLANREVPGALDNPALLEQPDNAAKASVNVLLAGLRQVMVLFRTRDPQRLPTNRNFDFATMTQEDAFVLAVSQIAGNNTTWKAGGSPTPTQEGYKFLGGEVLGKTRGFYARHLYPGSALRRLIAEALGVADTGEGTELAGPNPIVPLNIRYTDTAGQSVVVNYVVPGNPLPPGVPNVVTQFNGTAGKIAAAGYKNGRLGDERSFLAKIGVTAGTDDYPRLKNFPTDTTFSRAALQISRFRLGSSDTRSAVSGRNPVEEFRCVGPDRELLGDTTAIDKLKEMLEEAEDAGLEFKICSGYKGLEEQELNVRALGAIGFKPSNTANPASHILNQGSTPEGSAFPPGAHPQGWGIVFELITKEKEIYTRTDLSEVYKFERVGSPNASTRHTDWLNSNAERFGFRQVQGKTPWLWGYFNTFEQVIQTVRPATSRTSAQNDAQLIRGASSQITITGTCTDTQYKEIAGEAGITAESIAQENGGRATERTIRQATAIEAGLAGGGGEGAIIATGLASRSGEPAVAVPPSAIDTALINRGKDVCRECAILAAQQRLLDARNRVLQTRQSGTRSGSPTVVSREQPVRPFEGVANLFKYYEISPDLMVANIRCSADGVRSNPFGASPGPLSIAADLVIPGISGLRVGELFWIDRIPAFYKAFGAFQIINLEDTIDTSGWQTKIHARFNYLGREWQNRILTAMRAAKSLESVNATSTGTPPAPAPAPTS